MNWDWHESSSWSVQERQPCCTWNEADSAKGYGEAGQNNISDKTALDYKAKRKTLHARSHVCTIAATRLFMFSGAGMSKITALNLTYRH